MIPVGGPVTAAGINAELGRAAGSALSMNDIAVRLLACNSARLTSATQLALSELAGRSGKVFQAQIRNLVSGDKGALYSDGVNTYPLGSYVGGAPIDGVFTSSDGAVTTMVYQVGYTVARPTFLAAWTAGGSFIGISQGLVLRESGGDGRFYVRWGLTNPADNGIDLRSRVGTTVKFIAFTAEG